MRIRVKYLKRSIHSGVSREKQVPIRLSIFQKHPFLDHQSLLTQMRISQKILNKRKFSAQLHGYNL